MNGRLLVLKTIYVSFFTDALVGVIFGTRGSEITRLILYDYLLDYFITICYKVYITVLSNNLLSGHTEVTLS